MASIPVKISKYHETLNITSAGKWLFNPGGLNSYVLKEIKYGQASREPKDRSLGNPVLMKIEADYIFDRPPKSISTKSSGEIRSVLMHSEAAEEIDLPDELRGLKISIEQKEIQIKKGKEKLEESNMRIMNYEKRIREIESMPSDDQDRLKDEYNLLVNKRNEDANEHNLLIEELKKIIKDHDAEVEQFNLRLKAS